MDNNNLAAARVKARQGETPGVPLRALVFSGVILALSFMVYAGLEFGYKTFLNASIENLDGQIADLDRQAPADEKERDFIKFYSLATNVQRLLRDHAVISPIFDFFERNTLPDVAIETMKIAVQDGSVSWTGVSKDYEKLATQLAIYENASETSKVGLASSRFSEGVIQFEARSTMAANIFSALAAIKATPQTTTEATTPTTQTTTPQP
jgi:hypothetical protein